MDPAATWNDIVQDINAGDMDRAAEQLDNLLIWIRKRGFMPKNCPFTSEGLMFLFEAIVR